MIGIEAAPMLVQHFGKVPVNRHSGSGFLTSSA